MNGINMKEYDEFNTGLVVRNAYKRYTSESTVLNGLNMTVSTGSIYGLLGPSGCGKTTLLSSIIGLIELDSGYIQISAKSRSEIGYMPQDLCLHDQMTIIENCYFYGYLHGMSNTQIQARLDDLLSLLDLPFGSRVVKDLSGGQQKRVSMACTLIHNPGILILDEPTVGLDPILIENLWKCFLDMASSGKTIIITTHYIQEAHQAHKIALMRNGVLLAEKPPMEIIKEVACTNLEDAFLKLSSEQENRVNLPKIEYPQTKQPFKVQYKEEKFPTKKFMALTYKNTVLLKRDYILTSFILLLPGITMIIGNLSIGTNIINLKLGVVNEEVSSSQCNLYNTSKCFMDPSEPVYLSCLFIQFLQIKSFHLVDYPDIETAQRDVIRSKISAAIHFAKNYTKSLKERLDYGSHVDIATLERTFLDTWVDTSSPLIEEIFKYDLIRAMQDYLNQSMVYCGYNPKIALIPLLFETPVYGSFDEDFITYTINGMMALTAFFFPAFMSLVHIFTEKSGGITNRIMATGISRVKIITALMFFLFFLFSIELAEILSVSYLMFGFPMKGSYITVIAVLMMDGVAGLFLGFMLAVMYDDLMLASFTGSGSLMALGYVTGLMWPIEAQHYLLKACRWMFPVIETVSSLRDVNIKGVSFLDFSPIRGHLSNLQWIFFFLCVIYMCMKLKKSP